MAHPPPGLCKPPPALSARTLAAGAAHRPLQRCPMGGSRERRPGAVKGLSAPLRAVAAVAAAALGGSARPALPVHHKAAKHSPPASGTKRGKPPRSSDGRRLLGAAALLALVTLVAAAAAAGAVGWYAASILHERPEALAAAAAAVQAAVAPEHEGSQLLTGNYTVVVMSCELAYMLVPACLVPRPAVRLAEELPGRQNADRLYFLALQ